MKRYNLETVGDTKQPSPYEPVQLDREFVQFIRERSAKLKTSMKALIQDGFMAGGKTDPRFRFDEQRKPR